LSEDAIFEQWRKQKKNPGEIKRLYNARFLDPTYNVVFVRNPRADTDSFVFVTPKKKKDPSQFKFEVAEAGAPKTSSVCG
jgi:hypothetical protein